MEIILKIGNPSNRSCVVDLLLNLPKGVADELAADLNGDELKYAEMYRHRKGGDGDNVYSGHVGELARVQQVLYRHGVAYMARGGFVLGTDYEAAIDVHDYVV